RPGGRTDVATRITPAGAIVASCGRWASTESRRAASETVVAMGPWRYMPDHCQATSAATVPVPGEIPTRPHIAAGIRIDPNASVPWARGTNPAATAAALPPDEPPAE